MTRPSCSEEHSGNVKRQLARVVEESLKKTFPDEQVDPLVVVSAGNYGDYQCNNAMGIFSKIKGKGTEFKNPNSVGQAIMRNLPQSEMVESSSVSGPGFLNIKISKTWLAKSIGKMLRDGIHTWAPTLSIKTAVVDFSSPNIAKEMHVGHLRSTIIGDTLARVLEFSGVEVLRRNHVGDWGTQFPQWEEQKEFPIKDLQKFYKQSKEKFDVDSAFKERAQKAVVSLQGGNAKYRKAWVQICEVSRREFQKVYERLAVNLEEKGESFYNSYIPGVLKSLDEKGLIEESEGARVIHMKGKKDSQMEGKKPRPLIVTKSDGGFNYASTDLAALWYRINEEKAEWVIYVTDVGQREHFDMFFYAAKRAGWLSDEPNAYPKADHVGFGLVLGEDGKRYRTRSTKVVQLVGLLDDAKDKSKAALIERGKDKEFTPEELEKIAEALGYGAVKYADLKNNRLTNYVFEADKMLNNKGNTAVYLEYQHARICSIIRNSGKDVEELKKTGEIALDHADERALGLHLLKFSEAVEDALTDLLPNIICDYLYNLSEYFSKFYSNCMVVGQPEETSRLLLCEATAVVMRKCFHLLGITPVYKI